MNHFLRWSVLTSALVAAIGVAGGTAYGQGGSLPATKVGTVNIGLLFTKYNNALVLKQKLEGDIGPLKKEAEKIKDIMMQHEKWMKQNQESAKPDMVQAEKSRKAMVDGKRALEDLEMQARNMVGKKQESQLIQLYKEIHAAVQTYAQQNGYHVVLAYGDPPDQDPFTFTNITRKMNAMDVGAAVPFYTQTGLDISNEVLARLNSAVPAPPVPPAILPTGGTK